MKFPRLMAAFGGFATFGIASVMSAADPAPLHLEVDGKPAARAGHVVLLPSTDSRRLTIQWPAAMPPSGPALRTDDSGGTTFEMPLDARIRWHVTAGTAVPRSLTSIDLVPPEGGVPVTVTATVEVARQDSDGTDLDPWQAAASTRLLPGLPFDRDGPGLIGDVVIGVYPNEFASDAPAVVRRSSQRYRPPRVFYRLDEDTRFLRLSERLTLGRLCPPVFDSETDARYVAIDPALVTFWDAFAGEVESAGRRADALKILRGFVSPNERQRLERLGVQLASFSRYQYGDAIAVIYDERGDFRMDDLNGDGASTLEDAEILAQWARSAMSAAGVSGGLGLEGSFEGPNHIGTPYLHVDLRGGGIVEWRTP